MVSTRLGLKEFTSELNYYFFLKIICTQKRQFPTSFRISKRKFEHVSTISVAPGSRYMLARYQVLGYPFWGSGIGYDPLMGTRGTNVGTGNT